MPSIVNGLFSGRSGIASHGIAIAVIGDNISNASTLGYKTSRAEFADIIAGGQTSGKVVGSGSTVSSITSIFEQGTAEFTGRPLDLAIDGNGFFIVADGAQKFYTRAGNFKLDNEGYIVNQNGLKVLGFPSNGSGALADLNVNNVSQDSVRTATVEIAGNLDASAAVAAVPAPGSTYAQLNAAAEFSTVVDVFDSLGGSHTLTYFFFKTGANQYTASAYVNAEEITGGVPTDPPVNVGTDIVLEFNPDGTRNNAPAPGAFDTQATIAWANGSDATATIDINLGDFTQYSSPSNINSITQDGKGVGTVTSLSVEKNGDIFAILSNGQTSIIGTIGMVNFSNPEGLVRVGNQLLQQTPQSGEPIIGQPDTGTFGAISAGSVELSTVDIANEFVKLITVQRGFQANSRIITTINQLLSEIIQLV